MEVQFPVECVDGYLEWYITVSHPRIVPPSQHGDDVGPSHVGSSHVVYSHVDVRVPSDDVPPRPPPPYCADDTRHLQMIAGIMDNLICLVNPYGGVYSLASQEAHIARGGPI